MRRIRGAGAGLRVAWSRRRRRRHTDDLLEVARVSFVRLQHAWDNADWPAVRTIAAEALVDELREQVAHRYGAGNGQRTRVLTLEARLLALDELLEAEVASVEFGGLLRERDDSGAVPFRELWLLAKLRNGDAGWRLMRVQSLL